MDGDTGGTGCVDTQHGSTYLQGDSVKNHGTPLGVGNFGEDLGWLVRWQFAGYHRLVRKGDEERVAREPGYQLGQTVQELVVLLDGLSETETGVDADFADTEIVQFGEFGRKVGCKVADYVVVAGVFGQLHGGWSATGVHQYIGYLERSNGEEHLRVELAARDVVDDVGASLNCLGGRKAVACVDRKKGVGRELAAQ